MKMIIIINILLALTATMIEGCSSMPRTKWTDARMRVMIDPDSIDAANYVRISQALVASGKWIVVDRGAGFQALKKEQEGEHVQNPDRFLDREKFAHYGKLYGVGAVVIGHTQCVTKNSFLIRGQYASCQQDIAIINSNTGEIMATAEGSENTDRGEQDIAPSWSDTVAKLNDAYPKYFEKNKDEQPLEDYKQLSEEESKRMKDKVAQTNQ